MKVKARLPEIPTLASTPCSAISALGRVEVDDQVALAGAHAAFLGIEIGKRVDAVVALEPVRTLAEGQRVVEAQQEVVAAEPLENVGDAAAEDLVLELRAGDVRDAAVGVAAGRVVELEVTDTKDGELS